MVLSFRPARLSAALILLALLAAPPVHAESPIRPTTVGVLGKDKDGIYWLTDLENREPVSDGPYLYELIHAKGPLRPGCSYKATVKGLGLHSIVVGGRDYPLMENSILTQTQKADPPPVPPGMHWEWKNGDVYGGKGPKETIHWKPDRKTSWAPDAKALAGLPDCEDHGSFENSTVNIVVAVTPAAGQQWKFPEAPSVVAQRIIEDFNRNGRNIRFVEANGVTPDYNLAVTINETTAGTERDTAYGEITSPAQPHLSLSASSGDAAFTTWSDATGALVAKLRPYFETGYHTERPCIGPNGDIEK